MTFVRVRARRASSVFALTLLLLSIPLPVLAATSPSPAGNFSLQVTPSPLVTTVKPGVTSSSELKIRNAGTTTEKLKIEPRSFTLSRDSEQVALNDTTPPDIADWISFSQPRFTVEPGQWFTEQIKFSLPKQTGFSYSFALVISRQSEPSPTSGGRLIKGSVAVFTLVNVDRPGATRKLDVVQLTSDHRIYEFLPTKLSVSLKNSGNTIVQPYGNIFIQRGSNGTALATLPVNEQRGYILPGATRTVSTDWSNGFPFYKTTPQPSGETKSSLVWNWSNVSKFRIGKYTAKLVAVYDDGNGHDVPIQGEVSFWVIPWRSFLILLVVISGLWYLQHWRNKRKTEKAVKRALDAAKQTEDSKS